jgi:energy-converting hydrogenase Eha subunit G
MKVPFLKCREAYTALRREYLKGETKEQFDFSHTEVHVLYTTFVELFVLGVVLWRVRGFGGGGWLAIGALFFLLTAWAADARLHRHEFRTIVPAEEAQRAPVLKFLTDHGYIASPAANAASK